MSVAYALSLSVIAGAAVGSFVMVLFIEEHLSNIENHLADLSQKNGENE